MAKILFVDDEKHIRLLFREEFEDEGYEVITAEDGRGLSERIESEKPDLVVLDIKMVDCDGLDLLQDIKAEFGDLPAIICTAYDSFMTDMRSSSADAYVVKSFDLSELKAKIKIALDKKQAQQGPMLTEGQTLTAIENEIKDFLNQSSYDVPISESHPEFRRLMEQFKNQGYLKFCSLEESKALFNNSQITFSREIRKAKAILRKFAVRHGDIKPSDMMKLYETAGRWSVLSPDRFCSVSEQIRSEILKDFEWLKSRLQMILRSLNDNAFDDVPLEALKSALRMQKPLESDDQNVIDVFLGDLRHDLKNKLRNMKLVLDDLEEVTKADPPDMSSVFELRGNLLDIHGQLLAINDRLYDISYFKVATWFREVALNELIAKVLTDLRLVDSPAIRVEVDGDQINTNTDPNLLNIAFRQIIQNSVEALDDSGSIKISVEPDHDQRKIRIVVEDNGCGIAKDRLEKIFEKSRETTKKGHSGYGLALARMATAAVGGTIELTSEIGVGTRAVIEIPWET